MKIKVKRICKDVFLICPVNMKIIKFLNRKDGVRVRINDYKRARYKANLLSFLKGKVWYYKNFKGELYVKDMMKFLEDCSLNKIIVVFS
jgi:hypothetical protein